jgi:transposase
MQWKAVEAWLIEGHRQVDVAKRFHVTQPAISRRAKRFYERLGEPRPKGRKKKGRFRSLSSLRFEA